MLGDWHSYFDTSDLNFNGPTSFSYTVADPSGATANNTVSGSVTPVNDAPVASADGFSGSEDNPVNIDVRANDSDVDGDALSVTQVEGQAITAGGPAVAVTGGVVTLNASGQLDFTPNVHVSGPTSFSYTVADPSGLTSTATVSGNITPVNDAPVAVADGFVTAEDSATTIDVRVNDSDIDGDAINVTQVNGSVITAGGAAVAVTGGNVTLTAGGQLVFTPNANVNGPTGFSYTVADPSGATATATVSGTVTPVNDAPVAVADGFAAAEDSALTIDVRANDSDLDDDTVTVTQINGSAITAGGPAVAVTGGSVMLTAGGQLVFTPNPNVNGPTSFSYTVADPSGAKATATASGTVTPVNDAPVAVADGFVTAEDSVATIDVRANDSDLDGDAFTITQINGNAITAGGPAVAVTGGAVTLTASGQLIFTPNPNFSGAASFSYTVADPSGATASATISGSIAPVNDAPSAANDSFTTSEDSPAMVNVRANDSDIDGDALTVTQVNGSAITAGGAGVAVTGGVVTLTPGGRLVFTPNANYNGPTSFSYSVADPSGLTATATVDGRVTPVNDAPTASNDNFSSSEDSPATIDVRANDRDLEGDTLTVTQVNGTPIAAGGPGVSVSGGVVTLDATGRIVFTPTANYNGAVAFSYTVADTSGATATGSVSGSVMPVNDTPLAADDVAELSGLPIAIDVLANDSDIEGESMVVSAIDDVPITAGGPAVAVAGGSVTLGADGRLLFTPDGSNLVQRGFSYTTTDASGASATARVTLFAVITPSTPPEARTAEIVHITQLIELRTDPALFVLDSVNESRSALGLANDNAAMSSDMATVAEVTRGRGDDLAFAAGQSLDRIGLIGRDTNLMREAVLHSGDTLFVQHAVRHETLTAKHALFVHGAVRASQVEAKLLELRANAVNSAAPGQAGLLDPFALGAPAPVVVERSAEVEPAGARIANADADAGADADADAVPAPPPQRSSAAPGFAAQLRQSANEFRARTPRAADVKPSAGPAIAPTPSVAIAKR